MKRAQVTPFVIVGVVLIVLIGLYVYNINQNKAVGYKNTAQSQIAFSADTSNFQKFFDECAKQSILNANLEIGLDIGSKAAYETFLSKSVNDCMEPYLLNMQKIGYSLVKDKTVSNLETTSETLVVNIKFPTEISYQDTKFTFNDYVTTFGKTETVKLNNGMATEEMILYSTDRRAMLVIPKGTQVQFSDGTPVNEISLKIKEKHFDGLSNSVVIGNLAYEGLPNGARFNQPLELSMRVRGSDIPELMSLDSLSIAYWDGLIWKGLETTYDNGAVKTSINHFTIFSVVTCSSGSEAEIITPKLYKQQYTFVGAEAPLPEKTEIDSPGAPESPVEKKPESVGEIVEGVGEGIGALFVDTGDKLWNYFQNGLFQTAGSWKNGAVYDLLVELIPSLRIEPNIPATPSGAPSSSPGTDKGIAFCNAQVDSGESPWKHDQKAIVPTREEFVKVLNEEDPRIALSQSEMPQEKRIFGLDNPDKCSQVDKRIETEVTPYCCCISDETDKNNVKCFDRVMGEQECIETIKMNGYVDFKDPSDLVSKVHLYDYESKGTASLAIAYLIDDDTQLRRELTDDDKQNFLTCEDMFTNPGEIKKSATTGKFVVSKKIYGYNDKDCVSGSLVNGDDRTGKKPALYEVRMAAMGDSCIKEAHPTSVTYTNTFEPGSCTGPTELGIPYTLNYPDQESMDPPQAWLDQQMEPYDNKVPDEKGKTLQDIQPDRDAYLNALKNSYAQAVLVYPLLEPVESTAGSMCSDCQATIIMKGVGIVEPQQKYYSCTDEEQGRYSMLNINGAYECRQCTLNTIEGLTNFRQFYYAEPEIKGECSIEYGCGECLRYPSGTGSYENGKCTEDFEGEYFCHKDPGYVCEGRVLKALTKEQFDLHCKPCIENPSSSEDCVVLGE
ncbi:MAG: hypothetical protein ABIJ34_06005 [archaeon]